MRTALFLILAVMLATDFAPAQSNSETCNLQSAGRQINATPRSSLRLVLETPECQAWVDSVFDSLTPRQRAAQLFVATVAPNQGDASRQAITRYVSEEKVGGLLFSAGSMQEFADLTNYAQEIADVPVMMTLDGEWGPKMRVAEAPHFPRNMALGAIQDISLLYDYGREIARECNELGIQVNYAPVLDVNSNPANPVIGQRSFGEDPEAVARLGLAYALGLESGGVAAVGKHFPGHGDTDADSHKTLPVINHTAQQFRDIDLVPFKTFADAGISGIMVGHIDASALDPNGGPASMSHAITTELLRDSLGFDGLVFTDALAMRGAEIRGNRSVGAFKAGADVLLHPKHVDQDLNALVAAADNGEISWDDINRRCRKVLAYKYATGMADLKPIDTRNLIDRVNNEQAQAVNQKLSDACITVLNNRGALLPLSDLAHNRIAIVNIGDAKDNDFAEMCRKYANVEVVSNHGRQLGEAALGRLRQCNTVVAAVYNDSVSSQHTLAQLKNMPGFLPVFFINPYKMAKFRTSLGSEGALVTAYDDTPSLQKAAAKALFGGIRIDGRMPVNVNGLAQMGDGLTIEKTRLGYATPAEVNFDPRLSWRVDSIVEEALQAGAFPGCQVLVAKDGYIVVDKCYGYTTEGGEEVDGTTIYDLASVSKAVGTLPGVMKAYDLGLFGLDEPAYTYVPGLDVEGKREITPRMLLHHETGMPAALNLYSVMMDTATFTAPLLKSRPDADHTIKIYDNLYGSQTARMRTDIASDRRSERFPIEASRGIFTGKETYDTIMNRIYSAAIKPERKFVYSCLNFCLLMDLEQHVTGQAHDVFVTDSVWAPLGAYGFCYRPMDRGYQPNIAWTEDDIYLRKQHLHGYVHDELASFSGGVQGNAGVFGSATDIAKLCQMWLNDGEYGDARILSPETSRLFTTDKSPTCHRGLGFDKPDKENPDNSPTCEEANASVYGHLGFTGTVFWVDPENQMIFVFLSNRVDPTRNNRAFATRSTRADLMRLLYESL